MEDNEPDLKEQLSQWHIQPPAPGTCPICGTKHPPEFPHNKNSLFYQYSFAQQFGRWPTWADACAHCDEETKSITRRTVEQRGAHWD